MGDKPIKFRLATANDARAVVALVNSVYRAGMAMAEDTNSPDRAWTTEAEIVGGVRISEKMFLDMLERDSSVIVLAEPASAVPNALMSGLVGCVHLQFDLSHGDCHLGMLSVRGAHQRFGIGKSLMNYCENYARGRGAKTMSMQVITIRHELLAWYERRGYKRTGQLTPFGGESAAKSVLLKGPLEFETLVKML